MNNYVYNVATNVLNHIFFHDFYLLFAIKNKMAFRGRFLRNKLIVETCNSIEV